MSIDQVRAELEAETLLCNLPTQQRKFVESFLETQNGTQAYIEAGYRHKGKATDVRQAAKRGAYKLLALPEIQAAISASQRARSIRCRVSADRVIEELARIGLANSGEIAERVRHAGGLDGLSDDQKAAVAGVKYRGDVVAEIRMHDKIAALGQLTDILGLKKSIANGSEMIDFLAAQIGLVMAGNNEQSQAPRTE